MITPFVDVLKNYSSIKVGGSGKVVTVSNEDEVREALLYAQENNLTSYPIGEGTNSYFGENVQQFLFVVIAIKGVTLSVEGDEVYVTAGGGEIWDEFVSSMVQRGFYGIENLSYIPGTVGAAPVQNIGAYGRELKDVFVSCEVIDRVTLKRRTLFIEDCHFGYRDSIFKTDEGKKYIILSVTIRLSKVKELHLTYKPLDVFKDKNTSLEEVRDAVIAVRKSKLPEWREYPNCGSFFKNPVVTSTQGEALRAKVPDLPLLPHESGYKIPSAWLIEHIAEMKGVKDGNVRTWEKQPLVIVNDGNATADEIDRFAQAIKKIIYEKIGILLEQEVNRVG